MEKIGVRRVMDRLLIDPTMQSITESTVAMYLKDLLSINKVGISLAKKVVYVKTVDQRAELPSDFYSKWVEGVYECSLAQDSTLPVNFFNVPKLLSDVPDKEFVTKVRTVGTYRIEQNILYTAFDGVVKVVYKAIEVDERGFPLFPYDGSLLMAMEGFVKWRYLENFVASGAIQAGVPAKWHRQYTWYMGQYTSQADIPTYEEAVAIAHSWQRLVDVKSRNNDTDHLPEHLRM